MPSPGDRPGAGAVISAYRQQDVDVFDMLRVGVQRASIESLTLRVSGGEGEDEDGASSLSLGRSRASGSSADTSPTGLAPVPAGELQEALSMLPDRPSMEDDLPNPAATGGGPDSMLYVVDHTIDAPADRAPVSSSPDEQTLDQDDTVAGTTVEDIGASVAAEDGYQVPGIPRMRQMTLDDAAAMARMGPQGNNEETVTDRNALTDSTGETVADLPPPASVRRAKDNTALIAGAVRVPGFRPWPFQPGDPQIVAIATGLIHGQLPHHRQSVMVTSLQYGAGKTALAAGLALELARVPDLRVALLDADLVRPDCARELNIHPEIELLSVLSGEAELGQALHYSEADNLAVLFNAGLPGGAADLLSAPEMIQIVERLHHHFDVLVVDSPPVQVAADAFTLAPLSGGVLVAVRAHGASMSDVFQARRGLVAAHANVIGTVMTYAR